MSLWNGFNVDRFIDKNIWKLEKDVEIITIDLGHGQCSSCHVNKSGLGIIKDLVFDNEARIVPTAIRYENGKVEIGEQAVGKDGCIFYFKDSPKYWQDKIGERTKKQLIEDFVRKLFESVIMNSDARGQGERILLFVGCPSSETEWLAYRKQYAEMIENAVKHACLSRAGKKKNIKDVAVVILPESRAAFINAAGKNGLYMDLGILVLDFGSSTADATWMQTGRKAIEKSWRLGASEIERLMMKQALSSRGYSYADLDLKDRELYNWEFRRKKEMYYNNEAVAPSVIFISKKGEAAPDMIPVYINDEFMARVVGYTSEMGEAADAEQIRLRGDGETGSWADHCRRFIREVLQEVKSSKCACQAVVLTGGASKMSFIKEICSQEFGKVYDNKNVLIVGADEPSLSVSRGLARAALNDLMAEEKRKELIDALKTDIENELEVFAKDVAENLAEKYYQTAMDVMNVWADDEKTAKKNRNTKYLKGTLQKEYRQRITDKKVIDNVLWESFNKTLLGCREKIQKKVNETLQEIYHNRLDPDSYKLDKELWGKIIARCDPKKLCDPSLPDLININALETVLVIVLIIPLAVIDGLFNTNLIDKLDNYLDTRCLSQPRRKRMAKGTERDYKAELIPNISEIIRKSISKARENKELNLEELIADALDDAFDIMAFYGN